MDEKHGWINTPDSGVKWCPRSKLNSNGLIIAVFCF